MIEILEYSDEYMAAWSEFVSDSPLTAISHQIGWMDVMQNGLGHQPKYLLAIEGSRVKGILPLVIVKTWWRSRFIISLPWIDYGGICADDDQTEKLL